MVLGSCAAPHKASEDDQPAAPAEALCPLVGIACRPLVVMVIMMTSAGILALQEDSQPSG